MTHVARCFAAGLVALLATMPSSAQDARGETDFLDMVGRRSEAGASAVSEKSCGGVELGTLLSDKTPPQLETLLLELALDPTNVARQNSLGNYYAKRSLWNKAEHAYRCALAIDDEVAAVWNNLGIVYMGQRDYSSAVNVLERATKIDNDYALAFYNLGLAYDELGRYDAALDAYERAITLDPKLATIANNPHVAGNRHQTALFLRRLRHNQVSLATSLDE